MIALNKVHGKKGLPINCRLKCIDNSGAKIVSIIGILNKNGTKKRIRAASIGDFVIVTVKKGTPEMKSKMCKAIVVRTKARYFRLKEGIRVGFEDNAVVILNEDLVCKVTSIKGPVAKEAYSKVQSLGGKGATIL